MNKFTFIKTVILFLSVIALSMPASAQVCPGNITLSTQAQVDAFTCSEVSGNLEISGAGITDLSPLATLTSVEGNFTLFSNPAITSLDGLSSLTSVGGSLTMNTNSNLSNVDGLSSLTSVGGDITLLTNSNLNNLDGLSSLTSVGGLISITSNSSLSNLDGLSLLTSVGGDFIIVNNNVLTEYCGLFTLLNGGGLTGSFITQLNAVNPSQSDIIAGGPCAGVCVGDVLLSSQADVNAFSCTSITGSLKISGPDITNIDALSMLTSVGGYISLENNPALTNVDGLSSITTVKDYLYISGNTSLTNLDGLSSITSVGGYLNFNHNYLLTNLDGLLALTAVGGDIRFYDFTLMNVDGLSSLTSVGGGVLFSGMWQLENINGLSSLTSVGGNITLLRNPAITNLDGLSSLASVGDYIDIESNAVLTEFCGLFSLLNGGGFTGTYFVYNNGANPSQQDIIDGGPCPVVCSGNITLSSQAEVDAFTCNEISGNLIISGADINDLSPLSVLTSIGGNLEIINSDALPNLDGLSGITTIPGNLNIRSNDGALVNINGLSSLTSVGGYLSLDDNYILENVDGLASLNTVGGSLFIFGDSYAMTNIDGLSSLTAVGGKLTLRGNAGLNNIDSLTMLQTVGGDLEVTYNAALERLCGLNTLLSGGGLSGTYTVSGNAANPTQQEIIDGGACGFCEAPIVTPKNITIELDADGNTSIVALDILEPTTFTDLTSAANWLGYLGVIEEGVFVAGDITAIGDVKSTIDAVADQITLQPNFNNYYPENFDSPVLQGSTYIEEFGTLAGGTSFSFTGSVTGNTLDPMYEGFAFIRIFDDAFNFLEEISDPLVSGNDFTVQYNNTQPDAYIFQYGFTVEGPSGAGLEEASLGNAVVQGMTLNIAPYSSCGLESVVISQTDFDCNNLGPNQVTVTATDINGEVSTGTATVTVEDNEAPLLTVTSTPITLWPPNHKYETIDMSQLFVSVEDNCSELIIDDVYIASVTSDEPENGDNDGNTLNDIVIGEGCQSVQLRKERNGEGNGRVYTVNLSVDDENGNTGTASVLVYVPITNGGTAIDDDVAYEEVCVITKSSIASFTGEDIQLKNYPNPFSGSTNITFILTETENTTLKVYDTFGNEVATLFNGMAESGQQYILDFSATNLPHGIYVYHLQSGKNVSVMKKMILMK